MMRVGCAPLGDFCQFLFVLRVIVHVLFHIVFYRLMLFCVTTFLVCGFVLRVTPYESVA